MSRRGETPVPPPPPRPEAARAFRWYLDRLARGTFAGVQWRALGALDPALPVLAVANHTNWWDGFLSHQVTRALDRHFRILMEAEHLARYPMFRWIGAIPMERRSAPQARRDLAVAAACLAPDAIVWIYPQGRRTPATAPLERLEQGAAWMVHRHGAPLQLLPVGFRYPFTSEQRPEAWILAGMPRLLDAPAGGSRDATMGVIADAMRETLAVLDDDVRAERRDAYATLTAGRPSVNLRLDRLRARLGLLERAPERNG